MWYGHKSHFFKTLFFSLTKITFCKMAFFFANILVKGVHSVAIIVGWLLDWNILFVIVIILVIIGLYQYVYKVIQSEVQIFEMNNTLLWINLCKKSNWILILKMVFCMGSEIIRWKLADFMFFLSFCPPPPFGAWLPIYP